MSAKLIAKEWLYFVTLVPAMICLGMSTLDSRLIPHLVEGKPDLGIWLFIFSPYLLCQFVRSVSWAFRLTRSKPIEPLSGSSIRAAAVIVGC